jgi:hypothetical protein
LALAGAPPLAAGFGLAEAEALAAGLAGAAEDAGTLAAGFDAVTAVEGVTEGGFAPPPQAASATQAPRVSSRGHPRPAAPLAPVLSAVQALAICACIRASIALAQWPDGVSSR